MDKDFDSLFNDILVLIAEEGLPTRTAIKGKMSTEKFFELLTDDQKAKRYARATQMRAEVIESEMMEISDNIGGDIKTLSDGREVVDQAVIQRDRLRVDTRKWLLSKLHPKKYGDKMDVTSGDEPIKRPVTINVTDPKIGEELKKLIE